MRRRRSTGRGRCRNSATSRCRRCAASCLINLVLITIATLNTFDMVLPLTGGGPGRATEVVALYIYHLVFSDFQFGRGAAVAVVLMAIGLALSACYARMLQRERAA